MITRRSSRINAKTKKPESGYLACDSDSEPAKPSRSRKLSTRQAHVKVNKQKPGKHITAATTSHSIRKASDKQKHETIDSHSTSSDVISGGTTPCKENVPVTENSQSKSIITGGQLHKNRRKPKKISQKRNEYKKSICRSWVANTQSTSFANKRTERQNDIFEMPCSGSACRITRNSNNFRHQLSDNETPKEIRCSSRLAQKVCSSTPLESRSRSTKHRQHSFKRNKSQDISHESHDYISLRMNKTKQRADSHSDSNINAVPKHTLQSHARICESDEDVGKGTYVNNSVLMKERKETGRKIPDEYLFGFEKLLTDTPIITVPRRTSRRRSFKKVWPLPTRSSNKVNTRPCTGLLDNSDSEVSTLPAEKNMTKNVAEEERPELESVSQLGLFEDAYVWKDYLKQAAIDDLSSDDEEFIELKTKKAMKKTKNIVSPVEDILPWKEIMEHELVIEYA